MTSRYISADRYSLRRRAIGHHVLVARWLQSVVIVVILAACSSSHHGANPAPETRGTQVSTLGDVRGRMYADGGPPPPQPATAVLGRIDIELAGTSRVVARPHQDTRGYFHVALPPGTYEVLGRPAGHFASATPMIREVVVRAGQVSQVDLGIHMI